MKEYHKLVRDRIPEIIAEKGERATFRTLKEAEFSDALFAKLLEEANEVVKAKNVSAELVKELADLSEVVHAISEVMQISLSDIERTRKQRNEERGGFKKRLLLESTD